MSAVVGVSEQEALAPETGTAVHPAIGVPSSVKATVPPLGVGLTVSV
jgi:hypothetical protein